MEQRTIHPDPEWRVLEHLGDGGFGAVDLIDHPKYGKVARKKLSVPSEKQEKHLLQLGKEANIQKHLRHPNIVVMFEAHLEYPVCGIFLEYIKYGSVDKFLEQFHVTWAWKLQILYDVALAIAYLHEQHPAIIHGDLKRQNILIGEGYHAKISDFGFAQIKQTLSQSEFPQQVQGTVAYIAPEYLNGPSNPKSEKYDVYGYAITAWEILSENRQAYYDFTDQKLIPIFVRNGERPRIEDIEENVPKSVVNLIVNCWQQCPDKRPLFETIKIKLFERLSSIQDAIRLSLDSLIGQDLKISQTLNVPTGGLPRSISPQPGKLHISCESKKFVIGFEKVQSFLPVYLDSDNGLLFCLKCNKVISAKEYRELHALETDSSKSCFDLNESLLVLVHPRITSFGKEFLDALRQTDQEHVVNLILSAGEVSDTDNRVLDSREIDVINKSMFHLTNLIDSARWMEFLYRLVSNQSITKRHKEKVERWKDTQKRVDELLKIIQRRSFKNFCDFKLSLHEAIQKKMVEILSRGAIMVEFRGKKDQRTVVNSNQNQFGKKRACTETQRILTLEKVNPLADLLKAIECMEVNLIGSCAWQSFAVTFSCKTRDNCNIQFEQIYESCHLREIVEHVLQDLIQSCERDLIIQHAFVGQPNLSSYKEISNSYDRAGIDDFQEVRSKEKGDRRDRKEFYIADSRKSSATPVFVVGKIEEIKKVKIGKVHAGVAGVTWLDGKIYVVSENSNKIHVFRGSDQFDELNEEEILIEGLLRPEDMTASDVSRSIFISDCFSDCDNDCVWGIQVQSKEIRHWEMGDGRPRGLSTSCSGDLLVIVERRDGYFFLDQYGSFDFCWKNSIPLPNEIKLPSNAVQSTSGSFFICYNAGEDGVFMISELPAQGGMFVRTFDLRSLRSIRLKVWRPVHLSIDENNNIFVADHRYRRVILLNSTLINQQIFVLNDQPIRLHYSREKQMLIVGHGWSGPNASASLFDLRPGPITNKHKQTKCCLL